MNTPAPGPYHRARSLVGESRLSEAIELLRRKRPDLPPGSSNELTLHAARASDLDRRRRQGTLADGEHAAATQRLRLALLELIDVLEGAGSGHATADRPVEVVDAGVEAQHAGAITADAGGPSAKLQRDQVFISYSHADRDWMELLRRMVSPLVRSGAIDLWVDSRIGASSDWREEIQAAIARAAVAVLLVSDNFLASDFIHGEELPPILEAAEQSELRVLWVHVSPCLYEETPIARYQAAHDVSRPLVHLSEGEVGDVLKAIALEIKNAVAD